MPYNVTMNRYFYSVARTKKEAVNEAVDAFRRWMDDQICEIEVDDEQVKISKKIKEWNDDE